MNMHVKPSKFKVGDRVRVISNETRGGYKIDKYPVGATLAVERTCFDCAVGHAYLFDGHFQYLREDQIELAPKFAVGDKVRVVKTGWNGSYHGAKIGEEFVVKSVDDKGIDTSLWAFYFDEIEPVAVAPSNANYTSCAAAEVDNLADEYGGLSGLKIVAGRYYKTRDGRKVLVGVNNCGGNDEYPFYHETDGKKWHGITAAGKSCIGESGADLIAEWPAVAPQQPTTMADIVRKHSGTAVVMLIENGQPKPATRPYVHASRVEATTEAERLATTMPGSEFGVYELVTRRVADVVVRGVA